MHRLTGTFCIAVAAALGAALTLAEPVRAQTGNVVTINADNVLVINGKKVFPIGFTTPPPPDGKAPDGKNAIAELRNAGATFLGRTGAEGGPWNAATIKREQQWEDAAARHGMYCWVFLRELANIAPGQTKREAMLREVVNRFKDHPGLGVWKGEDEPAWGKKPVAPLVRAYNIIHQLDPNHPVQLTQAPRGTVAELRAYNLACDITGTDIYPVSYPPGIHSLLPNKEISMVGDYTRKMMDVASGGPLGPSRMPVWMILQIAWSGVVKPGKTLRFPTFAQERFMTYQAIINGARGLMYFGGNLEKAWTPEDARLGWAWHFWNRVLRPVIEEIGDKSPLYPALVAPEAKLPVRVSIAEAEGGPANPAEIEFCIREVGSDLFLLACKREGATVRVEFSGLPVADQAGEVMFEAPRTVTVAGGKFSDWFGPFEVHVYRFRHGTGTVK